MKPIIYYSFSFDEKESKNQERNMLRRSLNKSKKYYKSKTHACLRQAQRLLCISKLFFIHSFRRPAFLSGLRFLHFVI